MKLAQGAEAVVTREGDAVIKDRVVKRYRHPVLDAELRRSRARKEKKMLALASTFIPVPSVSFGDDKKLVMEFIDGPAVKEVLKENQELARVIGQQLGKLHKNDIIHGDLTTSNMVLRGEEVVFIDFGLSFRSRKAEDKAVDIHVFRQALESKHHVIFDHCYRIFLKGYRETNSNHEPVLQRLKAVEARGRNKTK